MEPATWTRTRTYRSRWPRVPELAGLAQATAPLVLRLTSHSLMQLPVLTLGAPLPREATAYVYIYRYIFIYMPGAINTILPQGLV